MADKFISPLQGMTAFISGASGGIGGEIARQFAEAGANLALTGRDVNKLAEVGTVCRQHGAHVQTYVADFEFDQQVSALAQSVLRDFGGVDILVNNAGLAIHGPILEINLKSWDRMNRINVVAPLLLAQAFIPGMIKRGHGKVINITSRAARAGHPDMGAYSQSKAALQQLSSVMAVEFGPHNIQVNCIAPTVTMTTMGQLMWQPGPRTDAKLAHIPAGRFAEPGDVANAALFLAAQKSGFVNGTTIPVDGGEGA